MATQNYFKVKNGLEFPSIETLQTTDNTGPSIKPSLNLDFAKTKALDPRITFTRASTATYYDGETTVKAEENLMLYSQDLTQASNWTVNASLTITGNAVVAPDGTTTAASLADNATSGQHRVFQYGGSWVGKDVTFSVYLKQGTNQFAQVGVYGAEDGVYRTVTVDLSAGAITETYGPATSTITNFGNGWYRVSISINSTSNATCSIGLSLSARPGGLASYSGTGKTVYAWGAQLEQRSFMTAYTPTTNKTVTNYIPVMQTAATNIARFDHDAATGESKGLLVEEARTNLLKDPTACNANFWTKYYSVPMAGATIAPDGTLSASKIAADTSNGQHLMLYTGIPLNAGSTYTFSIFAKAAELSTVYLQTNSSSSGWYCIVNLLTGAVIANDPTASVTSTAVGNGWYRVSCTLVATAGGNQVCAGPSSGLLSTFTGNGYSGIFMWGPQLELGTYPTSYIPLSVTYTGRAGFGGTFRGSNNLIQSAAPNAARYEQNIGGGSSLLLESGTTNYFTDVASGFGLAGGYQVLNTQDVMAPDGTYTASKFVWDKSSGTFYGDATPGTIAAPSAGTWTYSVWMKIPAGKTMSIALLYNIGGNVEPEFTGTGEWVRYSVTKTFDASSTGYIRVHPFIHRNPSSASAATEIYLWGLQLEQTAAATSYVYPRPAWSSRSSIGTYYDSTGALRIAPSGQGRYTYNPNMLSAGPRPLLENSATNLITYSENFTHANWSADGVQTRTADTVVAPDGNSTGDSLVATDRINVYQIYSNSTTNTFTFSCYLRKNTTSTCQLYLWNGTAGFLAQATFNFDTGLPTTIIGSSSMTYVGNNWYRCSVTATYNGTVNAGIYNNATGVNVYAWGAQLEIGSGATSYIPTTSATVTRAADAYTSTSQSRSIDLYTAAQITRSSDNATMTGTNFSTWYRAEEGTLYADFMFDSILSTYQYGQVFEVRNSGDAQQRTSIFWNATETNNTGGFIQNISEQAATYQSVPKGLPSKIAFAYKANDVASTLNGSSLSTDTAVVLPTGVNAANIGRTDGGVLGRQYIKRIAYYPKRLTNAELFSITAQ